MASMLVDRSAPDLDGLQAEPQPLSIDDAIRTLRRDPGCAHLVRDAYLGRDVADSARRFAASAEFAAVCRLVGERARGALVLDLGAGTGIASMAWLAAGASRVMALEPDPSDEVGRGAIARLDPAGRIEVLDGVGEAIPLPDASVDIVYARQVLHHARNLPQLVSEVARVLVRGGYFLACREHVVDDARQLAAFLAQHPVHQLAGGENAFALPEYVAAIDRSGLRVQRVIGPLESVINAFPTFDSEAALLEAPRHALVRRFGWAGRVAARVPVVVRLVQARMAGRDPGRLYSFVAVKPA